MAEELKAILPHILNGSYTGNGTTQSVVTNFRPRGVRIIDWTEGGDIIVCKDDQMPDAQSIFDKTVGAALMRAKILNGGITITDTGFTVGSSDYVNKDGHTFHWEVW